MPIYSSLYLGREIRNDVVQLTATLSIRNVSPRHPVVVESVQYYDSDLDGNALAYDAQSGAEVWRQATGKPIGGGVIAYQAGGRQHVAVAGGLNSPIWPIKGGTARVTVYALG